MKKFLQRATLALGLGLLLYLFTACGGSKKTTAREVNIYNWGEYIDPALLRTFEQETGIHVIYSTFATNEDLFVKLKNGGAHYDLICPSDYMIDKMRKEGLLEKLDYRRIPNFQNIDEPYRHQAFDPDQAYTVPYFWGTLGITYNRTMVREPVDSWSILWDPAYARRLLMMDSTRDSFAIGLIRRGYSVNTDQKNQLQEVQQDLIAQYPLVYAYLVDQIKDMMINEECALAVMFSGDAVEAIEANPNLAYVVPREGSNIWFDSWCIPRGAENKENAEAFINFMCRPDVMAKNAEFVGYSLPSFAGRAALPEEMREDPVAYPPIETVEKCQAFQDMGPLNQTYNELWQDVKNR